MFKTLHYVVIHSMHVYLKQEGLFATLGIIRRRLWWRIKLWLSGWWWYLMAYIGRPVRHKRAFNLDVPVVDHCNLNCWGCCNFSPLAKAEERSFLKLDACEKDMKRMAELFGSDTRAFDVCITGGEPLLHPDLEKFFPMLRKIFSRARIFLITNGIGLDRKPDEFWKLLGEWNVEIAVTVYPNMEAQYERARTRGAEFGIDVGYLGGYKGEGKVSFSCSYDLLGRGDVVKNFARCIGGREIQCMPVRDGRLYPCGAAAHIRLFNEYFGRSLAVTERDSIDIYAAKNKEEILNFVSRPIPFCRYCSLEQAPSLSWRLSERNIREWSIN